MFAASDICINICHFIIALKPITNQIENTPKYDDFYKQKPE